MHVTYRKILFPSNPPFEQTYAVPEVPDTWSVAKAGSAAVQALVEYRRARIYTRHPALLPLNDTPLSRLYTSDTFDTFVPQPLSSSHTNLSAY